MIRMFLRLRQGIGRLIRTHDDEGTIHIWMTVEQHEEILPEMTAILPVDMQIAK